MCLKVTSLTPLAVDLGFLVEEYAGSKGSVPPRKRRNKHALYVCTIEKAHTLVNCMIQEDRMREIGLVVVDEVMFMRSRVSSFKFYFNSNPCKNT